MNVTDILAKKGSNVVTIDSMRPVTEVLATLAEHNVGAVVVTGTATDIIGIVSERDVVRGLNERGAELLTTPVAEIMTPRVITCRPTDSVEHLTELMTERRIRHVPVIADGRLVGIVSIGDAVKSRIDSLEHTQEQLESYIIQG